MRGASDQEIRFLPGIPEGYSVLNLVAIGEKGKTGKAYLGKREEDSDRSSDIIAAYSLYRACCLDG